MPATASESQTTIRRPAPDSIASIPQDQLFGVTGGAEPPPIWQQGTPPGFAGAKSNWPKNL